MSLYNLGRRNQLGSQLYYQPQLDNQDFPYLPMSSAVVVIAVLHNLLSMGVGS